MVGFDVVPPEGSEIRVFSLDTLVLYTLKCIHTPWIFCFCCATQRLRYPRSFPSFIEDFFLKYFNNCATSFWWTEDFQIISVLNGLDHSWMLYCTKSCLQSSVHITVLFTYFNSFFAKLSCFPTFLECAGAWKDVYLWMKLSWSDKILRAVFILSIVKHKWKQILILLPSLIIFHTVPTVSYLGLY